ncbi:UDP-glycosyltransferase UGT5-like isoform X2 [Arctopsyche grandis]|uniref:UDP-glycosyltransferase UGT5-like isoform X2 n=1 Tax=Arctopsyche grandis TaxID=121162 RepID=UPI00406DA071
MSKKTHFQTIIKLSSITERSGILVLGENLDKFAFENMAFWKELPLVWNGAYFTTEVAFNSSSLQELLRNDKSHFDLIIMELFFQEAFYMFAHKYKAPVVAISTMGFHQYIGDFMGSPLQLAYMPHEFLRSRGRLGLLDRLQNLYYTVYDLIGRRLVMLPRHEKLVDKHFEFPETRPSIYELQRKVSLVLLNTHFSIDTVRPQVPGIVEIGGVHIKKPKPLPQNLQNFIDESKDGVIFFSMGSNLNSKDMPKEKLDMFLNTFKKLKQRVLWKWENENLPGQPSNVMISKWLPQTDILAHPNVKIFITHGGLLSTIEAIHFGKPIIGIPVYGDQHLNTARAQSMGIGVKLAFSSLTEAKVYESIREILDNPTYSNTAKELSDRFRDRPQTPMETAVYWIEYVIRHKGAQFMKSPLLQLEWYEAFMLDVVLVIFALLALPVLLVKKLIKSNKKKGTVAGKHNGKPNKNKRD